MKTFTKALLAAGFGLLGTCGVTTAAVPYGTMSSNYGIAAGGCYGSTNSNRYDSAYDQRYGNYSTTYRPTSTYDSSAFHSLPSRSVYDAQSGYRPLPHSTNYDNYMHRSISDWKDNGNADCSYRPTNPRPTTSHNSYSPHRYDAINSRYEDRYDGSPSFEPWRPLNASNASRKNW